MKAAIVILCLILVACGGGDDRAPRPTHFAWWGAAIGEVDYLAEAPGATLALFVPERLDRVQPMAERARALGLRPVLMLWVLVRHHGMRDGWPAILDAAVRACGDCDYYLADEPYIQAVPWTPAELDAVAARLPAGRAVLLSLSTPELQREVYVPPRVTLGANLYSSAGETPASALRYLDTLATYGRPMYLNLDGIVIGRLCPDVQDGQVRAAITLNDAMLRWARTHAVTTYIAFAWQSSPEPDNLFCGTRDLPALREYMAGLVS